MLVPPELQNYYTDDFNLNSKGQATRKLSEYGLICMDEFDKETTKKMPLLKNLMQMASLSFINHIKRASPNCLESLRLPVHPTARIF